MASIPESFDDDTQRLAVEPCLDLKANSYSGYQSITSHRSSVNPKIDNISNRVESLLSTLKSYQYNHQYFSYCFSDEKHKGTFDKDIHTDSQKQLANDSSKKTSNHQKSSFERVNTESSASLNLPLASELEICPLQHYFKSIESDSQPNLNLGGPHQMSQISLQTMQGLQNQQSLTDWTEALSDVLQVLATVQQKENEGKESSKNCNTQESGLCQEADRQSSGENSNIQEAFENSLCPLEERFFKTETSRSGDKVSGKKSAKDEVVENVQEAPPETSEKKSVPTASLQASPGGLIYSAESLKEYLLFRQSLERRVPQLREGFCFEAYSSKEGHQNSSKPQNEEGEELPESSANFDSLQNVGGKICIMEKEEQSEVFEDHQMGYIQNLINKYHQMGEPLKEKDATAINTLHQISSQKSCQQSENKDHPSEAFVADPQVCLLNLDDTQKSEQQSLDNQPQTLKAGMPSLRLNLSKVFEEKKSPLADLTNPKIASSVSISSSRSVKDSSRYKKRASSSKSKKAGNPLKEEPEPTNFDEYGLLKATKPKNEFVAKSESQHPIRQKLKLVSSMLNEQNKENYHRNSLEENYNNHQKQEQETTPIKQSLKEMIGEKEGKTDTWLKNLSQQLNDPACEDNCACKCEQKWNNHIKELKEVLKAQKSPEMNECTCKWSSQYELLSRDIMMILEDAEFQGVKTFPQGPRPRRGSPFTFQAAYNSKGYDSSLTAEQLEAEYRKKLDSSFSESYKDAREQIEKLFQDCQDPLKEPHLFKGNIQNMYLPGAFAMIKEGSSTTLQSQIELRSESMFEQTISNNQDKEPSNFQNTGTYSSEPSPTGFESETIPNLIKETISRKACCLSQLNMLAKVQQNLEIEVSTMISSMENESRFETQLPTPTHQKEEDLTNLFAKKTDENRVQQTEDGFSKFSKVSKKSLPAREPFSLLFQTLRAETTTISEGILSEEKEVFEKVAGNLQENIKRLFFWSRKISQLQVEQICNIKRVMEGFDGFSNPNHTSDNSLN